MAIRNDNAFEAPMRFLRHLEFVFERQATPDENQRWQELFSDCSNNNLDYAIAMYMEDPDTAETWPSADDIARHLRWIEDLERGEQSEGVEAEEGAQC